MYIEYYIIENLLINYIIISCTSILIKQYNSKKKWMGAFLGTLYSLTYIYPSFKLLFTIPFKIIIMAIIIFVSFSHKNKQDLIRTSLVNIFICGSTYLIIYFTGIEHMKISFLILCVYVSCELLKYIYKDIKSLNYIKSLKRTIDISLLGKHCSCEALVDSGNLLKDPLGNNEVIIVKSKVLKGIISDELVEYDYENIDVLEFQSIIDIYEKELSSRIRLIPYKHAGSNKSSIILGFKADYIEIDKNKISNIIIGLSNFNDLEYDAILSPNIL